MSFQYFNLWLETARTLSAKIVGQKNRLRTTGRGYMQAGFPNIIRKTLSVKTNCLMKRTRMIHSCLHIAAVVYRAVFPSCLSSVFSFLEFRCFSVFLRFFLFSISFYDPFFSVSFRLIAKLISLYCFIVS